MYEECLYIYILWVEMGTLFIFNVKPSKYKSEEIPLERKKN